MPLCAPLKFGVAALRSVMSTAACGFCHGHCLLQGRAQHTLAIATGGVFKSCTGPLIFFAQVPQRAHLVHS